MVARGAAFVLAAELSLAGVTGETPLPRGASRHDIATAHRSFANTAERAPRGSAQAQSATVQIEMRNVRLHVDDGVVLDVARLRGMMVSREAGAPPVFDDQRSYVLRVSSADMAMDMPSLTNLMNRRALAYKGAPLSNVRVTADGGMLRLAGKLHKGVTVPFSAKVSVGADDDGRIRLHSESMKALGIPSKGLLDLLGLELDDLVHLKEHRGVEVRDNDILVSPGRVLPAPEMQGRVARASIVNGRLAQTFGAGAPSRRLRAPDPSARNYIYFNGGDIRFGKLTMHQSDLQLIDADPGDAFDFYPARYTTQLVAGYSKNTPSGGLKTYMPDYDDVRRNPRKSLAPRRAR